MAKKNATDFSGSSRESALMFPETWRVFGPVARDAALPAATDLAKLPARLKLGGKTFKSLSVRPVHGRVDLAEQFGKPVEGRTAYVFISITAPKTGRYFLGLGADWWLTAWVDGKEIHSTLEKGNGKWPPSKDDHLVELALDEGDHVLAIRVISGTGSTALAVGTHASGVEAAGYERARQRGVAADEYERMRHLGMASRVLRPLKIVFIGAGSNFLQTLVTDFIGIPGADVGELALVDLNPDRLDLSARISRRIVEESGKRWKVVAETDRRKVLKGAHYVINCIEVNGAECVMFDYAIPMKYGIDQCIGDTLGPGGMFKAMRTVPVFLDILRDVEKYCPDAWVLNYTNPMSMMCLAAARASKAKVIGLCHSVQCGSHQLADWLGVPYHELEWDCAGINHLAWFTQLEHQGRDMYPVLKERVRTDPTFAQEDKIRIDLMMHFGFYLTESSGHDSEYLPYYRTSKAIMDRYCGPGYSGESGFYARGFPGGHKVIDAARRKRLASPEPFGTQRSWEYASYIIQALETNAGFVTYSTMPNNGLITNLPQDGVVEVACLVDRRGIRPTHYGRLPPQCAALCDWNMRMIDLAADACIRKSVDLAAQALMLDPLSAASCPADIRKMTFELYEAQKRYLPGFKA